MVNKKEIARRYDSSAEIYDNRYKDIQDKKYREIFSRVDIRGSKAILDVGCGTGTFLNIISETETNGTKLVGIDLSPEMIKIAHTKYPNIDFIVADSDALPIRDLAFSKVFSVTHLQNLPQPEQTLDEMVRISMKDTVIAISILRKTWSRDKLSELIEQTNLQITDSWNADVEDIGVICKKK
ncbi:MAG: class I SAM-dependent methyltransferase [Candidatus Heimdallarchaeota archaeon]